MQCIFSPVAEILYVFAEMEMVRCIFSHVYEQLVDIRYVFTEIKTTVCFVMGLF